MGAPLALPPTNPENRSNLPSLTLSSQYSHVGWGAWAMISYSDLKLFWASIKKLGELTRLQSELDAIRQRLSAIEAAGMPPKPLTCRVCGHNPMSVAHEEQDDDWGHLQITRLTCPSCGNREKSQKRV
jgi:hypothetical protein